MIRYRGKYTISLEDIVKACPTADMVEMTLSLVIDTYNKLKKQPKCLLVFKNSGGEEEERKEVPKKIADTVAKRSLGGSNDLVEVHKPDGTLSHIFKREFEGGGGFCRPRVLTKKYTAAQLLEQKTW